MESELRQLSDLGLIKFTASHKCLYGLERLGIKGERVHRKKRRDWTETENKKIKDLLTAIVNHNGDHNYNYYKYIIQNRIIVHLAPK